MNVDRHCENVQEYSRLLEVVPEHCPRSARISLIGKMPSAFLIPLSISCVDLSL